MLSSNTAPDFNDKFKGTVTFTSKNGKEEVLMMKGDSDWAMVTNQARGRLAAAVAEMLILISLQTLWSPKFN